MKLHLYWLAWILFLLDNGVSGVDTEGVSVNKGDSVTLQTSVETNQQEEIKWYFNDTRIAQISGDLSYICTDVQCNNDTERFKDRLKLDHQTGSLTITNITNTHSGLYDLKIIRSRISSDKIFSVTLSGVSAAEQDEVKKNQGEVVTLDAGEIRKPDDSMMWYFNEILITEITGDQSKICTDVQCNERFRDRLKLDHQTGSLTITNITNTDDGVYELKIISRSSSTDKTFNVTVSDVPAAELHEMEEGESVTLDTGVIRKPNDEMTWYFNEIRIAEITGDQSKICTDDQCEERFRDRLKLDHRTGSLTITNTRNTDSGEYTLQININNSSFSISTVMRFNVTVTAVPGSGLSSGVVAGISVVVLLVAAAAVGVIYRRPKSHAAVPKNVSITYSSFNTI
ncbi:uncharacterized protein LOC127519777 isoform X3 [Ctenopharyngodon idella]|uniref:uncharacterized protein LOC127519777 isoform X3 n=1 Tax=Ctenopharyngodon idella TaxID=7959 RepID=UPI0022312785|nr:uncharacterized protein LOC127519777 isoform X3 [Ctenopharyngodon idella]